MMTLEGKVAIVTGGSKGIGATIAKELASYGVKVAVNYNSSAEAAEKVVNEIKENGGECIAIQADVSYPDQAKRLVEETKEAFGQLDILVNNAGINMKKEFTEVTDE